MWNQKKVERALFRWQKWKRSIVGEWYYGTNLRQCNIGQLRTKSRRVLETLGLGDPAQSPHILFEIYWISCVESDYVLDNPVTYESIQVPDWLPTQYNEIVAKGDRVLPPTARTIGETRKSWFLYPQDTRNGEFHISLYPKYHTSQDESSNQKGADELSTIYDWDYPGNYSIIVFADDELYKILTNLRGRTRKKSGKQGRPAEYSDRQAVKCAALKDSGKKTYIEIARELGLPFKEPKIPATKPSPNDPDLPDCFDSDPYVWEQSDTARHLVDRGRRIISELS
jgi:hypothetical protein